MKAPCQIDQSNKIEQTERDTVLAIANGIKFSVLLKAHDKRKIQIEFRKRKEPRNYVLFTFAALLAILIKYSKANGQIVIDKEYEGYEKAIEDRLIEYLGNFGIDCGSLSIEFRSIGKLSPAHKYAAEVTVKNRLPDMRIKFEEIRNTLFRNKKDRASKKDLGLLNFGLITDDRQPSRSIKALYNKRSRHRR